MTWLRVFSNIGVPRFAITLRIDYSLDDASLVTDLSCHMLRHFVYVQGSGALEPPAAHLAQKGTLQLQVVAVQVSHDPHVTLEIVVPLMVFIGQPLAFGRWQ